MAWKVSNAGNGKQNADPGNGGRLQVGLGQRVGAREGAGGVATLGASWMGPLDILVLGT